jgi:hypothetical protein
VLEGGTTNGGAVLRIADQYIPVLFGTTLVSRIAVPRDATNLFILARGVNCDSAIAHVIIEASTFTKIRDPSGVFDWSFTLSPSCVTASGTILMPSYTITPEVVCFHSPTSKVCRITSADPDIYFVTTQGFVREYTPTAPYIPPNTFTNSTIQVQLSSTDMALSTRASVTNIPAHLCNPNGVGGDEYPNGQYYSTWCKFENGVHLYAEGYGPTNCPCLPVFTNAFECICSGDGRRPCECAHAVRDPKSMPLNADQTNVLGHAALVIGGTNDLLQVTVPEGTYRPCPQCACSSGEPSSASVYRQTSCIEVTPSSLTADGEFSVAGISPSTNFADTVFMYKITDYSSAQAVTSYTRKDYTVLGTSVYPTDPGHSVSNWFIGCNVTNALTLWTGVKLPSDTGDVTLSVTVESGTPLPQLYVYNRIAQSNELLVTQGQLTFTQNLGDWRSTYCDTNGYVQAYLLCASGGVARVTHNYETYSGQPCSILCSNWQQFSAVMVELKVTHPQNPGPTGSAAKYSITPNMGSAENLFSTWVNEPIRVDVNLCTPGLSSNLPPGVINWTSTDFTIPDNTMQYTFGWNSAGMKTVTVELPSCQIAKLIRVDIPDVGSLSQSAAAALITLTSPAAAALIASYADEALDYANTNFPAGPERDAFRHTYWNALCVSHLGVFGWQSILIATGHEHDNRDVDHQQAFNSTMDLHNNAIGVTINHTTILGVPDRAAIQNDIQQQYESGALWIWAGGGEQASSEGILIKSNGENIYTN